MKKSLIALFSLFVFAMTAESSYAVNTYIENVVFAKDVELTFKNTSVADVVLFISEGEEIDLPAETEITIAMKIGEVVFMEYKNKRHVLLIVSKENAGDVVDVATLIAEKKSAIDGPR